MVQQEAFGKLTWNVPPIKKDLHCMHLFRMPFSRCTGCKYVQYVIQSHVLLHTDSAELSALGKNTPEVMTQILKHKRWPLSEQLFLHLYAYHCHPAPQYFFNFILHKIGAPNQHLENIHLGYWQPPFQIYLFPHHNLQPMFLPAVTQ